MSRIMMAMAAMMLMTSAASAQQSINLYFDQPSQQGPLAVGETFTINVKTDIVGYSIYLADFSVTWDPAVLDLENRQISDEWLSPFDVSGWLTGPPGWVYCGVVEFSQAGTNFTTGTHTIVTYTFRVVGPGSTALTFGIGTLSAPGMTEQDGVELPVDPITNGQYPAPIPVTIVSVTAPTSATVGDVVDLTANVSNSGTAARDVTIEFWANPTLKLGEVTQNIAAGQTAAVTYSWDTTLYDVAAYPMYIVFEGSVTFFAPLHLNAVVVIPPVVPAVGGGSGGGGGGGGCSSGTGAGTMMPVLLVIAILIGVRIR